MTDQNQKQRGKTLRNIADQQRRAMNADDFRDHMKAFSLVSRSVGSLVLNIDPFCNTFGQQREPTGSEIAVTG